MASPVNGLFDVETWRPALEKYAEATNVTIQLYDGEGRVVLDAVHPTPLFDLLERYHYVPGLGADGVRQCMAQGPDRPAIVVTHPSGLAVFGTSLVLDREVVGVIIGAYVLSDFVQSADIQHLAHQAGIPFMALWDLVRRQQPMPRRRLLLHGELLQVLGDALLKENARTRRQMAHAANAKADADAKDEFLAVLSHELRTPLTPILGWTQILRKSHYDPRQVQRGLEVIERNALLEARLVEDLLDLNRIARGKMSLDLKVHDVNHLLREAVEPFLEAAATKGIVLEIAAAGEPLIVRADGGRLQQIFRNLLSNAVKFTDIGGHIVVTATKDSEAAIITVKDDGQGIAPEFLPSVFEMFRQQEEGTRRQHVGLGIGLALVRRIVDLHGGRVSIASAGPGRGTEARVWLPLTMGEIEPVDLVPTMTEMSSNIEGLTVLVVEDVEDMREMLRLALEAGGAHVVLAANGVEALERMETGRLDVVLCDLRMPRMDGFEFLRRLRRATRLRQPPVIAISGLASTGDRRRTREAGFEGHVEKPFKEGALLAAVNAVRKPARHSA